MRTLPSDYTTSESDFTRWWKAAKGLMLSARVLWNELYPLLGPDTLADDRIDQVLAYWHSYLLLTAYAFENIYRAILTARGRSWREALKPSGGHGLTEHIGSVTALDQDEANLI